MNCVEKIKINLKKKTYGVCNVKSMSSCGHEYAFLLTHLKKFISSNPVPRNATAAENIDVFIFVIDIDLAQMLFFLNLFTIFLVNAFFVLFFAFNYISLN